MDPVIDIIGRGRIGGALAGAGVVVGRPAPTGGLSTTTVRAGGGGGAAAVAEDGWAALALHPGRPLLVATRNDDLADVVDRVPPDRRADLVFVQNGMIRGWLAERGLAGATRGVLLFAVAARGDAPVPGGDSVFTGPHAEAMASYLRARSIPAVAVDGPTFADVELEKLLWICAFGVIGEATKLTVGEIVRKHDADVAALAAELAPLARTVIPSRLPVPELVARMRAYALGIPAWRPALREWTWRNGWFDEAAAAMGARTPEHARWLAYAQRG